MHEVVFLFTPITPSYPDTNLSFDKKILVLLNEDAKRPGMKN
jgi:hypothetical protein